MQDSDELTPQQRQVLVSLLGGSPITRAAEAAEVDPSSIYRWLKLPAFQQALREGRRQLAELGLGQLQQLVMDAVAVVREVLNDTTRPAAARLRAAELVFSETARFLELGDLEARLAELEALIEGRR